MLFVDLSLPVWMSLCVSKVVLSLKVFPQSSHMKSFMPAEMVGRWKRVKTVTSCAVSSRWSRLLTQTFRLVSLQVPVGLHTHLCVSCSALTCWPSGRTCDYIPYTRILWCPCEASCGASEHVWSSCLYRKSSFNDREAAKQQWSVCRSAESLTFATLGTQVVTVVIVNSEVLLQHVLPCKRFATFIATMTLHSWVVTEKATTRIIDKT